MENNENYQWQPPKKKVNFSPKKFGTTLLVAVLLIAVAIGALTCFYTVDDKQQAVVTTFGKVTDVVDAGMHFKLPFGIQNVDKLHKKIGKEEEEHQLQGINKAVEKYLVNKLAEATELVKKSTVRGMISVQKHIHISHAFTSVQSLHVPKSIAPSSIVNPPIFISVFSKSRETLSSRCTSLPQPLHFR